MGQCDFAALAMFSRKVFLFKFFAFLVASQLYLAGCTPQAQRSDIPHELYTQAVRTVAVQLTQNALLTPSITPTLTPEPTPTQTNTPEPTSTVPSPTPTWKYNEPGEVKIPILAYEDIVDSNPTPTGSVPGADNFLSAAEFHQQIETLHKTGYQAIPMTLLVNAIRYGAELPVFPVVITFDSTSIGIFDYAFPIMDEFGYVGNIFLTVNQIDTEGNLSQEQIAALIESGWRIGSRGMSAIDLTSNYPALSEEIYTSKSVLEERFDIPITIFSYPFGRADDMVAPRVSEWGYDAAVGLNWSNSSEHNTANLFYLSRFDIKKGDTLENIFERLPWQPASFPTAVPVDRE